MYTEFTEILNGWEKFLSGIETKMQLSIKAILDEAKDNNKIYVMFFEYEWDLMNLKFFAQDVNENILITKYDLLLDEINANPQIYSKDNAKYMKSMLKIPEILIFMMNMIWRNVILLENGLNYAGIKQSKKKNIFQKYFFRYMILIPYGI